MAVEQSAELRKDAAMIASKEELKKDDSDQMKTQTTETVKEDTKEQLQPTEEKSEPQLQDNQSGDKDDKDEKDSTANEAKDDKKTEEEEKPNDDGEAPPPLPDEPLPEDASTTDTPAADGETAAATGDDDGWDPMWSDEHNAWYFYNRFTQQTQWENPRVPTGGNGDTDAAAVAGGYNPAIHGDYDPNAWYAKGSSTAPADDYEVDDVDGLPILPSTDLVVAIPPLPEDSSSSSDHPSHSHSHGNNSSHKNNSNTSSNSQQRYTKEAKAYRQMNAFYDVDAVENAHDGRSLKAERAGKKPTRAELKAFREKRRAKKEEKRRAWLRD